MVADLARKWWLLALRGVSGILFSIGAFVWPGLTFAVLVPVFGAYVLLDGIFAVVAGIGMRRQMDRWWLLVLEGVAGIILGVLTFRSPAIIALALLSFIAVWAIISGVFEIATAVRLRRLIENEWLLIVSGIVSVIFGILLLVFPGPGALSLVWLIGSYALLFGIRIMEVSVPGDGEVALAYSGTDCASMCRPPSPPAHLSQYRIPWPDHGSTNSDHGTPGTSAPTHRLEVSDGAPWVSVSAVCRH